MLRKISDTFVNVYKLNEFRVKMRISERTIRHEGVIEVFWVHRIMLEDTKLGEFGLGFG